MSKQKQNKTIFVHNMFLTCIFGGNSMSNLLSYCGLTDARMRASEKDLPVFKKNLLKNISRVVSLGQKWSNNGFLMKAVLCGRAEKFHVRPVHVLLLISRFPII